MQYTILLLWEKTNPFHREKGLLLEKVTYCFCLYDDAETV